MTERLSSIVALVQSRDGWLRLERPSQIIEAREPTQVAAALASVEALTHQTRSHAVGFVTYEAAAAFGLAVVAPSGNLPLLWFALFPAENVTRITALPRAGQYVVSSLVPSLDAPGFEEVFRRIKSHIVDGDTYQVNYTFRMRGAFAGDAGGLFSDLVGAQRGLYSMYLHLGSHSVCSASPELFFEHVNGRLQSRPMKGTASRGRTLEEDAVQRQQLRGSPKQQAENVMIVDMVRNDLGRVATTGTVAVPELFSVERYPNVWQMTSLVTAESTASLPEIFRAAYPSASVTGAPKVRTMELLSELEREPRGVYTGTVGHVAPDGAARFNVAIRTAVVDHEAGTLEFGIGSGIVWDSEAEDEYRECLLKGSILTVRPPAFELLETIRWNPADGFFLLERHLQRLRGSAEYFGFSLDESAIRAGLIDAVTGADSPRRLRLLAADGGTFRVERSALSSPANESSVALASAPVDDRDVFLFHKTTNRGVYERARGGRDDVILWNRRREITESTVANVVAELDGVRVTPPVSCGLLAGTFRAELLARGELRERVITIDDLLQATGVWLINSVQEWRRVTVMR